jgi:hypothetical protein
VVADYDSANILTRGNNKFDYNAYHVSDVSQYQWAWGIGYTWNGIRQLGQEVNGTIDNILPPPGGESTFYNIVNVFTGLR